VVKAGYVPDAGDLVWASFDPQAGHEQAGRRPALVMSPASYNGKVGLALACPITSHAKGYPFEVDVRSGRVKGVVLADQLRSLDWKARNFTFAGKLAESNMAEVKELLRMLLELAPD
jgi:mRNA interferase MazF